MHFILRDLTSNRTAQWATPTDTVKPIYDLLMADFHASHSPWKVLSSPMEPPRTWHTGTTSHSAFRWLTASLYQLHIVCRDSFNLMYSKFCSDWYSSEYITCFWLQYGQGQSKRFHRSWPNYCVTSFLFAILADIGVIPIFIRLEGRRPMWTFLLISTISALITAQRCSSSDGTPPSLPESLQ